MKHPPSTISNRELAFFAAPNFSLAIMHMPVFFVIPALYAANTTITMSAIASILLIGRIFDAVTDPLIGFFSDRTQSRLGKRKPWMIAGTPLAMVAIIFLFSPPPTAGATYFLVWSITLFVSWTLIDIPSNAWGAELSRDYNERSRIMTWRAVAGYSGNVVFMLLPLMLMPFTGTTEIGIEAMTIAGWIVAFTLPILMYCAIKYVPSGTNLAMHRVNLKDLWDSARRNKTFYRYVASGSFSFIAMSIWGTLLLIYLSSYMGIGDKFIFILLTAWITRIFVAPLWLKLIYRFGKHKIWATGAFSSALMVPTILLIPIGPYTFSLMLLYALILGFTETAWVVAPRTILGDIIDYDILKTGADKASIYFALDGLIIKFASGVGSAIAFFLLSAYKFDVHGGNDSSQLTGLILGFTVLPPILYTIAGLIIWNFPLDSRRQAIIKRRIESRKERVE